MVPTASIPALRLMTQEQLSESIGIAVPTLRMWRTQGKGPRFIRVGGKLVRYSEPDVTSWLESQKCG